MWSNCKVTCLGRLFAVRHTAVKFDARHMLTTLLSQKESPLHDSLRSMPASIWESHIRVGFTAVLQNRVGWEQYFALLSYLGFFLFLLFTWLPTCILEIGE